MKFTLFIICTQVINFTVAQENVRNKLTDLYDSFVEDNPTRASTESADLEVTNLNETSGCDKSVTLNFYDD